MLFLPPLPAALDLAGLKGVGIILVAERGPVPPPSPPPASPCRRETSSLARARSTASSPWMRYPAFRPARPCCAPSSAPSPAPAPTRPASRTPGRHRPPAEGVG